MRSHFLLLTLFAFFVSLVFSLLAKDDPKEQMRFGGMMFAGFPRRRCRARLADVSVSFLGLLEPVEPLRTLRTPRTLRTLRTLRFAHVFSGTPVDRLHGVHLCVCRRFPRRRRSVMVSTRTPRRPVRGLGALLVRALAGGWRRRLTSAPWSRLIMMAAAYGVSDEFHQSFVPCEASRPWTLSLTQSARR